VVARDRVAPSAVAAAAATSTSRLASFIVHGIVVEGVRRTGVRGGRRRRRRRTSPTELIGRHGHALLFVSFLVVVALAVAALLLSVPRQRSVRKMMFATEGATQSERKIR
jgi:hypothetical protein